MYMVIIYGIVSVLFDEIDVREITVSSHTDV